MERRIKVWLITLVVLLIAALFSTVLFKLQLDKSNERLNNSEQLNQSVNAEITELTSQMETDKAEAAAAIAYLESAVADYEKQMADLEADAVQKDEYIAGLEASKNESVDVAVINAENERLRIELEAAMERVDELEAELSLAIENAGNAETEDVSDELASALAEAGRLRTQLAEVQAQLDTALSDNETLSAELADVNARVAELEAELEAAKSEQASADESRVAELEADFEEMAAAHEAAEARTAEVEKQLEALKEAADAELAAANAELEAYRSAYRDTADPMHASSELDGAVNVISDGITAEYEYFNNSTSGNSVIFSLLVDDQAVYTSGKIAPGEGFSGFNMDKALATGEYDAVVCISTLNSEEEIVSNLRLPTVVHVAE